MFFNVTNDIKKKKCWTPMEKWRTDTRWRRKRR